VILACVDDSEARALVESAQEWNLDVLVEVHDEHELDRALALDAAMIGINHRDLNTFVTDISVTERLAPRIPAAKLAVAESGISAYEDLVRLGDLGVTTFLVGESLMRERDVRGATRRLLGR
jgi:indole-3-glycerol phosphate synthase